MALSAVSAGDTPLDATVISKWNYFSSAATDKGLVTIKAEQVKLGLTEFVAGKVTGTEVYGCGQCIMSGLEYWIERTTTAGDNWNKNYAKASAAPKAVCCLPNNLTAADSCDPTGMTKLALQVAAKTYTVNADSSRTWKTPEVALLSCPIDTEVCGSAKVVTLKAGTASTLTMGDGSATMSKDKTSCSWIVKSACKPITLAYDTTSTKTAASAEAAFQVQWVQLPASAMDGDKVKEFTFTKPQLISGTPGAAKVYPLVQVYSSGVSTAAFNRDYPFELAKLWATQYNALVPAYTTAVTAYEKEVKDFNLVHAQKKYTESVKTAAADLTTYLTGLTTYLKTTAATPADSTVKKLPEYPSITDARPLAFAGPALIAEADKAKAAVDSIYVSTDVGSGSLLTGFLTLATDKVQGYGTMGVSAAGKAVNLSAAHLTKKATTTGVDCAATYVGVFAVAREAEASKLKVTATTGDWTLIEIPAISALPAVPALPLAREAAQYLAAGAASIALVAASLY